MASCFETPAFDFCSPLEDEYALPMYSDEYLKERETILNGQSLVRMESSRSNGDKSLGFIDSHCHLDFLFDKARYQGTFQDYIAQNNFPSTFEGCVAVFCKPRTFKMKAFWETFLDEPNVWGAFGCHPHHASEFDDDIEEELCKALEHPKVRALGEIGLDYSIRNEVNKLVQFDVLRRQLRIAKWFNLNIVVHCREAHEDAIKIIKEILPVDYRIHLHCFTDKWDWAQRWMEEFPNLLIGITNVVTFKSATQVREVAKNIPLSRLLLETDAPYFVPRVNSVPKSTKNSNPGMALYVAKEIANLKKVTLEEVIHETRKNTRKMYGI